MFNAHSRPFDGPLRAFRRLSKGLQKAFQTPLSGPYNVDGRTSKRYQNDMFIFVWIHLLAATFGKVMSFFAEISDLCQIWSQNGTPKRLENDTDFWIEF